VDDMEKKIKILALEVAGQISSFFIIFFGLSSASIELNKAVQLNPIYSDIQNIFVWLIPILIGSIFAYFFVLKDHFSISYMLKNRWVKAAIVIYLFVVIFLSINLFFFVNPSDSPNKFLWTLLIYWVLFFLNSLIFKIISCLEKKIDKESEACCKADKA
jgi:hypothetical protein